MPSEIKQVVNRFAILVHRTPQVMLLAIDTHKDFVEEKHSAVPVMVSLQSPSKIPAELYAPEAY